MADIDVTFDPISITSGPVTVDVTGLNDIKVDSKLAVTQPIQTDSKLTLSVPDTVKTDTALHTDGKFAFTIPEPIRTDSKAAIDLQPVILDQCLRLSLGPLPLTRICLPNRQRIGFTLFGVEVFGLTLDGEAQVTVGEPPSGTHVVALGAPHADHRHAEHYRGEQHHREPPHADHRQHDGPHVHERHPGLAEPYGDGLRIRLG